MIDIISILFVLFAILIVKLTSEGCNKTINTLLACMIIFIFGLEELTMNMEDGAWYDIYLAAIYTVMAFLFYRVGGHVQSALASVGLILHIGYLCVWSFDQLPINLFYTEAFVTLTFIQLLAASNGVLRPILYRMINGGNNGRNTRNRSDVVSRNITYNGKP